MSNKGKSNRDRPVALPVRACVSGVQDIIVTSTVKTDGQYRDVNVGYSDLFPKADPNNRAFSARAADIPSWQRDCGYVEHTSNDARQERQKLLQSLALVGHHGIIVTQDRRVVVGTQGWFAHMRSLTTLELRGGQLGCVAKASQRELIRAIDAFRAGGDRSGVPVAPRDLDGWGRHLVQLRRVGFYNSDLILVLLPKSSANFRDRVNDFALPLSLTTPQADVLKCIMDGCSDQEIAQDLGLQIGEVKKITRELVAKFCVRQKSDIVRLISSAM
jgi:DNA-binding NarL/FixJ family response regulator